MTCATTTLPDPGEVDVSALRARYQEERNRRMRLDGQNQYDTADESDAELQHEDPHMPYVPRAAVVEDINVAVLGGGWAGVLSAYHLRKANVDGIRIIDQAGDFGGVWYWNRYPGLSCDNDSLCYLPLLEEMQFAPSRKFADGLEIREYCQHVARASDLYRGALFHTKVLAVKWNAGIRRWKVTTNRGDELRARFVVMANGPINTPKVPRISGVENFRGKIFHTARWDYDYTGGSQEAPVLSKLADKRVAIVGTGASAIQAIPHLGRYAKQLFVVQRTASTVDERKNTTTDKSWVAAQKPGWQRARQINFHKAAIEGLAPGEQDVVCDIWTEINRNLAAEFTATEWPQTLSDYLEKRELMDYRVMERLRARVDALVNDKETAAVLKPWYRFLCKRPASSDDYYATFNRPNVSVLDVSNTRGIEALTSSGIVHDSNEYPVDCLIFASGFEVTSDLRRRWGIAEIEGHGGRSIYDHWKYGYRTLHGTMTHGFPNQFYVGFYQGGFNATTTETFNCQGRHIAWIIGNALAKGLSTVEPDIEAQDAYVRHVRETAIDTSEFSRECTPGYFNNEGEEAVDEHGDRRPRSYAGETYGPGFYAFEKMLDDWRNAGDCAGLRLDARDSEVRQEDAVHE